MTAAPVLDLAFFDHVPPQALALLAQALTGKAPRRALPAVVGALNDLPALHAWVQALPDEARAVLEFFSHSRGYGQRDQVHGVLRDALGPTVASAGLDVLEALGVVFELPHLRMLGCMRPLTQAVQPLFDAAWCHSHPRPPENAAFLREAFAVQVLLAHLQSHPVRITRVGQIHGRDAAALHKVFAAWSPQWLEQAVSALRSLGALSPGKADTLTVRPAALEGAERLDAAAWYVLLHKQLLDGASGGLLRYFVRRPGVHPLGVALAHLSLHTKSQAVPQVNPWAPMPQPLLNDCIVRGLLRSDASRQALALAPAPAAALQHPVLWQSLARASATRPLEAAPPVCHVQPNLELMVPPNVDFATLLLLCRWCDVLTCDTVATLRITSASVQRAAAAGHELADFQRGLQACARYPVADNVRRTVDDFGHAVRSAYLFDGLLVVSQNDTAALQRLGSLVRPTRAPGTFRMTAPRGQIIAKLQQAGFSPVDERAPQLPTFTDCRPPLLEQAQAYLSQLVHEHLDILRCCDLPPVQMPAPRSASSVAMAGAQDCG